MRCRSGGSGTTTITALATGSRRSLTTPASSFPMLEVITISRDRKSTRLNSSHITNSYAVFCLKKKKIIVVHAEIQEAGRTDADRASFVADEEAIAQVAETPYERCGVPDRNRTGGIIRVTPIL